MNEWSIWALLFLLAREEWAVLEEPAAAYGLSLEEYETQELVAFVERATQEVRRRSRAGCPAARAVSLPSAFQTIRITRTLRIFVGPKELKIRPMAKTVLLLFLRHPEGIPLKLIGNYRAELAYYYGKVSRTSERADIDRRVRRMEDIFNNELNVNIARVNAALTALVDAPLQEQYRIGGGAGQSKAISLDRSKVVWE